MAAFDVVPGIARYLISGFASDDVIALDVTDPVHAKILYGYAWLYIEGQAGLYLGLTTETGATCIAVATEPEPNARSWPCTRGVSSCGGCRSAAAR